MEIDEALEEIVVGRVLAVLVEQAEKRQLARITGVELTLGAFLPVSEPELMGVFEARAHMTVASGAMLRILRYPASAWCFDCACKVPIVVEFDDCPICNGSRLEVIGGQEIEITKIEAD